MRSRPGYFLNANMFLLLEYCARYCRLAELLLLFVIWISISADDGAAASLV